MLDEAPNRIYYRAVEGSWRAPLDLVIADWRAFRTTPMGIADRLRLLALVATGRLLGSCRLDTRVDASQVATRGEVVHTTRVSKWGVTLMRSREQLTLDSNGRDLTMRIEMRLWPILWRVRVHPPAPASVDPTGRRATYRFAWLGTEMRQRGERSADGTTVTLTQETAFSRGVQVLRRRRPGGDGTGPVPNHSLPGCSMPR
jgi:hypothetical protein